MSRFLYGRNGQPLNRELEGAPDIFDEILGEESPTRGAQAMEISGRNAIGSAAKIEKYYTFHALGVITLMKRDRLQKRQLASGLYVYEAPREVRLEPGIEAAMPGPNDVIAFNFEDFGQPPAEVAPLRHDHVLWVAQGLINYDFGVQHQERAKASRSY